MPSRRRLRVRRCLRRDRGDRSRSPPGPVDPQGRDEPEPRTTGRVVVEPLAPVLPVKPIEIGLPAEARKLDTGFEQTAEQRRGLFALLSGHLLAEPLEVAPVVEDAEMGLVPA